MSSPALALALMTALRLVREANGVTQQQVANQIGCGRPTVNRWERGVQDPSLAGVLAYAEMLGLRVTFERVPDELEAVNAA